MNYPVIEYRLGGECFMISLEKFLDSDYLISHMFYLNHGRNVDLENSKNGKTYYKLVYLLSGGFLDVTFIPPTYKMTDGTLYSRTTLTYDILTKNKNNGCIAFVDMDK